MSPTPGSRVKRRLGWLLGALAWTAIVIVIALGGAGLVVGLDHPPGSAGRPDVTASGDAVVVPMLDAAESDLADLADQVEALGTQARGALAALNGSDPAVSDAAIAEGDRLVRDVVARTAAIRRSLASVPYIGTPEAGLFVSDPVVERHARAGGRARRDRRPRPVVAAVVGRIGGGGQDEHGAGRARPARRPGDRSRPPREIRRRAQAHRPGRGPADDGTRGSATSSSTPST